MPFDAASPLAPPQRAAGVLDPITAAMLQAGFAGMSASGPSRMPVSLGQVIGQAGQAGLSAHQQVAGQLAKQEQDAAAAAEAKRLNDARIAETEAQAAERNAKVALEQQQAEYLQRPEVQAAIKAGDIGGVLAGMPKLTARDLGMLKPDKAPADPQVVQLIKARDALPEGHPDRAVLNDAIKKSSTHQEPMNVYTGSLTAGVDEHGNPVFVQSSGRPDTPPRVVPGVRPPPPKPSAADVKDEKDRKESEATVASVRATIAEMQNKLQSNAYIVGVGGAVRRGVETVAGMAAPDMPTPALDYQNDLRLLLADVRKVVEKDPNLSNQERGNLYEMLGGGTFQTPGSAFRTLNNVLGFIENKKMTGPSRPAQIEQAVRQAGWGYEPDKYEYRVVNGEVQRRPKGK